MSTVFKIVHDGGPGAIRVQATNYTKEALPDIQNCGDSLTVCLHDDEKAVISRVAKKEEA